MLMVLSDERVQHRASEPDRSMGSGQLQDCHIIILRQQKILPFLMRSKTRVSYILLWSFIGHSAHWETYS